MNGTVASTQPLVSVIIASYNHGEYIESCIKSVLEQTYGNVELLVVDDGSCDDSVERIRYLQQIHGFDFRAQDNLGLSRTLNEAITRSRGEFIAPFGSDDIMLPQRLELQVFHMQSRPEVGICAGNIEEIDATGNFRGVARKLPARRLDFEDIFLNRKPGAPAPTLLFRRKALEQVGCFDPQIRLEDLYVELKITRAGYFIDVLSDVLALYRVHGNNTYKNHRFMAENVLKTYEKFNDHWGYQHVRGAFLNSMLLKVAKTDRVFFFELLRELPLLQWRVKTVRAIFRAFESALFSRLYSR